MSKTKELAEALAYEPEKTIDMVTREALTYIEQRMTLTQEMLNAGSLKGKVGDTLVIRRPVPYKPR